MSTLLTAREPLVLRTVATEGSVASSRCIDIARVLLLATLLAAPLAFGAVQAWAWTALSFISVVLLLLWAGASLRSGVVTMVWSPLYLPVTLFLVLGLLQFFAHRSLDSIATRESLVCLGANLILFFLAGQVLAAGRDGARRFALVVVLFGFCLSMFAILQFFSSRGMIYWSITPRSGGWIFGPYVNHNHYAGLMEMLIPVAVAYLLCRPLERALRAVLIFAVVIVIASLLLSGSRGGFVSLLAEFLIFAAVVMRRVLALGRWRLAAATATGILGAAALFLWMDPGDISRRLATVVKIPDAREVSFGQRRVVTLDTLRIVGDYRWTGAGLGAFETVYPRYRSFPSDLRWDHAHNDYAEALAETGLVGGALIVTALGMFFPLAFRNLTSRLDSQAGWIQFGAAVGCCGLLVHSLFDFNLHIPANACWFAVCAAVAVAPVSGPPPLRASTVHRTLSFRT